MPYRIAVIADIHGILPSLEAVLADIDQNPPNEIVVAGDFLLGPQPQEVLSLLWNRGCQFILGNGEVNMLKMHHGTAPKTWWTHRQFDMGTWIFRKLAPKVFSFLDCLPEQVVIEPKGCAPLRVLHGAPWDINKLIFPDKEPAALKRALAMIAEDVMIFAHTHIPNIYQVDGKLAINPGSISNNLNGDNRASYATLTWEDTVWNPQLHFVSYDYQEVVKVFIETGFMEENRPLSRAFLESIFTGQDTVVDYINYAYEKASDVGYRNLDAVPNDVWIKGEASFPWQYEF